jgi:histidine triad (HIT) family protein
LTDCIFCRIASGEIPAKVVFENDLLVAFDDIAPQAPVHTLIVPRKHYTHLGDDVPADLLAALLQAVPEVARAKGVDETGYRVIVNCGRDAAQTIDHLHVHVLGGRMMAEGMLRFAGEE